jgi:hypothetical protein
MKFNNDKIKRIELIINRVKESGQEISQMLSALRAFILSKLYYFMMNSIFNRAKQNKLDINIRKIIDKMICDASLAKDLYNSSMKYGS